MLITPLIIFFICRDLLAWRQSKINQKLNLQALETQQIYDELVKMEKHKELSIELDNLNKQVELINTLFLKHKLNKDKSKMTDKEIKLALSLTKQELLLDKKIKKIQKTMDER